ncbi:MAG: ketoacyl-ACP synthase III [Deltaproteobacteria bacterium]|nr:ketoacyl-ACP synthase III [Deltaproteobacteria bacterium]
MRVFRPGDLGRGVRIRATGRALPARVVTNADLVAMGAPLSDDEMVRLSGIRTRHWLGAGESTGDLALTAAREALARSGLRSDEVDRLILATVSPDHPSPATACRVQHALGLSPVPAYDVAATCTGFVFALEQAARAVCTGDRAVLAVAADARSRWLDVTDRATCALFGDGAGAALVTPGPPGAGLIAVGVASEGSGFFSVHVPAGGAREPITAEGLAARRHTIRMADGPQVYMQAVEGLLATAEELLAATGLALTDVDLVVPHQANRRLVERFMRLARLPAERVLLNVDRLGNISGASTAVALDEALTTGRVRAGARVLILAAGAGYTAGAALLVVDEALLRASGAPA